MFSISPKHWQWANLQLEECFVRHISEPSQFLHKKHSISVRLDQLMKTKLCTACLGINVTHFKVSISAIITDISLYFSEFIDNSITF